MREVHDAPVYDSHCVPALSRSHQLTLRALLGAQPRHTAGFVFPSARIGGRMSGWTQLVRKLVTTSGVDFTLHDLRRTFQTMLSDFGVGEVVAEACIAHARADLVRRYDRSQLWAQRVHAANLVADHIATLIAPKADDDGVVVPLAARR